LGICDALKQFHNHNPPLAHRDLKPGNVLLGEADKPVLMDFGSVDNAVVKINNRKEASQFQELINRTSTPLYRSPELFSIDSDFSCGPAIDIWSMGCILYALMYNKSPFDDAAQRGNVGLAAMSGIIKFPPSVGNFTEELKNLVKDILKTDPNERPTIDLLSEWTKNLLEK